MNTVKLIPATKDYIWGGKRLITEYGIKCNTDICAEAWVLSCHKDGPSIAENGKYKGLTLEEIINKEGTGILGENCKKFEFFPILVKLIDAQSNLSIQVHPSDEYALKNEGQYGKTEMWYVVDCNKDAFLYYGFNKEITKQEFEERIKNNTLLEVLNKVNVHKGDCFFIESGTIHAICSGILIAEIQQNSNLTYRVYDYGRVGADGKSRQLHIDKAVKVTDLCPPKHPYGQPKTSTLASCKYFTSELLSIKDKLSFNVDNKSFVHLLCIEGTATVNDISVKSGESLFIPAQAGDVIINGKCKFIRSKV